MEVFHMKAHRILVCLFLLQLPLLFGQLPRTYVSGTGDDSNTCARSLPCLTFAGAAAKTTAGGEIDALDSGDFGSVMITQAVTIDGGSGVAAISATQTCVGAFTRHAAICILAGGGDTVILRNLSLSVPPANVGTGIEFGGGAYLRVENVAIAGAPTMLNGVEATTGTTTLDHVRITNAVFPSIPANGTAVHAVLGALVSINNSTISFDGTGVVSQSGAVVNIDSTLLQYNAIAVFVGSGSTVRLSNTTITDNVTGLLNGGGTIVSYVNNRINGNTTNGAPTQSVYQK
jgi:hypothetical protein